MRNTPLVCTFLMILWILIFPLYGHSAPKNIKKYTGMESEDRGLVIAEKRHENLRRVALVIGNSSYRATPLDNPTNDSRIMAAALRRLGFEVEEVTNLGYSEMTKCIENFGNKLMGGGIGLFYYAGHGMQVNGVNYLIPVDAQIEYENEVRLKAVDVGMVLARMEQARSEVNIVILDACRDNPFIRSFRTTRLGLASMEVPNDTLVAYATAPGRTADDGDGRNSIYTAELVRLLEIPGITLDQIFDRTLAAVQEKSKYKQNPLIVSNVEGEFYFIQPPKVINTEPAKPVKAKPLSAVAISGQSHFQEPNTGMEFVRVPGGCFQMGDVFGGGENDEKPVHEVCVSDYFIGKYEVTREQWQKVMNTILPNNSSSCDVCPVEEVSWNEAQEFIGRLNSLAGVMFRLPTESEWEYAARSGGKREKFSGGDNGDAVAWFNGNSLSKTHSVGQKQANGLDIYDMSGNVWEWVNDWYEKEYYGKSSLNNPEGPSSGTYRVLRGGSWSSAKKFVRTSYRFRISPDDRSINLGFRLALPLSRIIIKE